MAHTERVELILTPTQIEQLKAIVDLQPPTKSQALRTAVRVAAILSDVAENQRPVVLQIGDLEVTNKAYRLQFAELAERLPAKDKTALEELYDAAQLKPTIFGMGVDLKPLLKKANDARRRIVSKKKDPKP